jgi:hypothetical protein
MRQSKGGGGGSSGLAGDIKRKYTMPSAWWVCQRGAHGAAAAAAELMTAYHDKDYSVAL